MSSNVPNPNVACSLGVSQIGMCPYRANISSHNVVDFFQTYLSGQFHFGRNMTYVCHLTPRRELASKPIAGAGFSMSECFQIHMDTSPYSSTFLWSRTRPVLISDVRFTLALSEFTPMLFLVTRLAHRRYFISVVVSAL